MALALATHVHLQRIRFFFFIMHTSFFKHQAKLRKQSRFSLLELCMVIKSLESLMKETTFALRIVIDWFDFRLCQLCTFLCFVLLWFPLDVRFFSLNKFPSLFLPVLHTPITHFESLSKISILRGDVWREMRYSCVIVFSFCVDF